MHMYNTAPLLASPPKDRVVTKYSKQGTFHVNYTRLISKQILIH